jgi:DegV family protein with EDD domain
LADIGIVTDSTAYLNREYVERYDIKVVPLKVILNDISYREGVDISNEDFYSLLRKPGAFPTTSQPSVGDFLDAYKEMSQRYDGLISIHISEGISGTCDAARSAASEMGDYPIEVIDSRFTAGLLGLFAVELAQARDQGKGMEELKELAGEIIGNSVLMFMVATLEYLHRGGRIGGAQALFGSVLRVKPILFIDGIIDVLERVRGANKALDRLVEIAVEKAGGKKVRLAISHVEDPERMQVLMGKVIEALDCEPTDILISQTGPVIGAHVGPGTAGIGFFPID